MVFRHPEGGPNLTGRFLGPAGHVPLAPSVGPSFSSATVYAPFGEPGAWPEAASMNPVHHHFQNSASIPQQQEAFDGGPRWQHATGNGPSEAVPSFQPSSMPDRWHTTYTQSPQIGQHSQYIAHQPAAAGLTHVHAYASHPYHMSGETSSSAIRNEAGFILDSSNTFHAIDEPHISQVQPLASNPYVRTVQQSSLDPSQSIADTPTTNWQQNITPEAGQSLQTDLITPDTFSSLRFVSHPDESSAADRQILPDTDEDEDADDPYDVEMQLEHAIQRDFDSQRGTALMFGREPSYDTLRARSIGAYLNTPNVLATYRPSYSTSPLTDEATARIFYHFVAVTGPCISIFERQVTSSSNPFGNMGVAASAKSLWTYTLPNVALNHPPLMHAMLALSALHIARLQQTSEGPSIKHFTYALRRVSKLISLPKRRNEVATLAALLLIGFHEILLADHMKWNIHLGGAKILVMEIDFAGSVRRLRRMRRRAMQRLATTQLKPGDDYVQIAGVPQSVLDDRDWEIDQNLVSQLTGMHVQYDNQWHNTSHAPSPVEDMSDKDIDDFRLQQDLYWWYAKQDIFQGMVSGNQLLMPYDEWLYCPPRGQIGLLDKTFATMDHLCLIMARLVDFGGKDQKRKRRAVAAQGGQWRPPPGFFGPGNPPVPPIQGASTVKTHASSSSAAGQQRPSVQHTSSAPVVGKTPGVSTRAHSSTAPAAPSALPPQVGGQPMYGMIPPSNGPVEMHSAFCAMTANLYNSGLPTPSPPTPIETSLEAETTVALSEHTAITTAFDRFSVSLGPDFEPLPPDAAQPISTPFGHALQYRSYPIYCIWNLYHVGRILLHRLHPHSPPAAMVSAGVNAAKTAHHAQTVGKICAGLYMPALSPFTSQVSSTPLPSPHGLHPFLGSALIESTFPLFFAAVQYSDTGQRGWTVAKLRDVARLTGWQTSATVAAGCEKCWEKMGEAGKGPKYVPTVPRPDRGADDRVPSVGAQRPEPYRGDNVTRQGEDARRRENAARGEGSEEEPDPMINPDRRFINVNPNARVHWALGLLGVEEDLRSLDLDV